MQCCWMGRVAPVVALLTSAAGAWAGSGDVNGDGSVTRADASMALRIAGGLSKPTFGEFAAASANGGATVTMSDAVRIARIARGLDPAPPAGAMATSFSLTVSANATRNIALPGGYTVTGTVLDRAKLPFTGGIAFQDTTSKFLFGPFAFDNAGAYTAILPTGTYQAIVTTRRSFSDGAGEITDTDTAVAVGSAFAVTKDATGRSFTRADLTAPLTVDFNYAGPSSPMGTSSSIILHDTGATAATYGLNHVETEVLFTPAPRSVPRGTYYIDSVSSYALSSGQFQDFYVFYNTALSVTGNTARTLAFPTVYELDGAFTGPSALLAVDLYARQVPKAGKDLSAAYVHVPAGAGNYLLAMPSGALTLSVGLTTGFTETMGEWILPYTMPGADTRKDVNLPALPAFRAITGTVVGPDGAILANATVAADTVVPATIPTAGLLAFHASTTTDDTGAYTMDLPNGTYTVTVTP